MCPSCQALTHAATLKRLAVEAEGAAATRDPRSALEKWREALELLPPGSRQHEVVAEKISVLGREVERAGPRAAPPPDKSWLRRGWGVAAAIVIFAVTKFKLLLVGLTKIGTLGSMLLFMGVYLSVWGWKFAVGFVLGIYIHEMGHVAALRHYGIAATAPMFIPGLGAVVRLKQQLTDVRQDARVGLAGPIWGLGAGLAAWAIGQFTGSQIWLAIAHTTGFINLFNLIPFWQLDGGRGFHALNRAQRIGAALVIGLAWWYSRQGILVLLLIMAGVQVFSKAPEEADNGTLATYAALIVALTWLSSIQVATGLPS